MPPRILMSAAFLLSSSAALAGDGMQVPEGSQVTLFALGLAGVLIGRRLAIRDPGQD
ncbi:hypothetical protein GRI89_01395 [Altererythrobacter salegens]|uniref:PEP-CTERM protein-sorting domain-containing protein n=1 Tax=Croceibacterium salegens TaxID=1737568 RepID=A0A6I4STA1_9SPHN|nr:hypothetical protein [Croceibacterium salegens]MXO58200.1 hypothetical protein [Croceibacterium salegens]